MQKQWQLCHCLVYTVYMYKASLCVIGVWICKFDDPIPYCSSAVYQWKKDDVGVWLKQMSPTLHTRYSSLFAKHDVTGNNTKSSNLQ